MRQRSLTRHMARRAGGLPGEGNLDSDLDMVMGQIRSNLARNRAEDTANRSKAASPPSLLPPPRHSHSKLAVSQPPPPHSTPPKPVHSTNAPPGHSLGAAAGESSAGSAGNMGAGGAQEGDLGVEEGTCFCSSSFSGSGS